MNLSEEITECKALRDEIASLVKREKIVSKSIKNTLLEDGLDHTDNCQWRVLMDKKSSFKISVKAFMDRVNKKQFTDCVSVSKGKAEKILGSSVLEKISKISYSYSLRFVEIEKAV
jgi:adenylate kinase family enzyme